MTWNLNMRTSRCVDFLRGLSADVLVVQEAHVDQVALSPPDPTRERWAFAPSGKTFGVLVREGYSLQPLECDAPPWCIPVGIAGPDIRFTLIATWALTFKPQRPSSTDQLKTLIDVFATDSQFAPLVIAGDMNASARQGTHRAHLANVNALRGYGLESAFHWRHGYADDSDVPTTLRWVSDPSASYHCDLVFVPPEWRTDGLTVTLGDADLVFGGGLSDHLPVIVDLPVATSDGEGRAPAAHALG